MIIEAHKKANMDEHSAVFQVDSAMPDTTFLFLYAPKSLADVDASGPMHSAVRYRDGVGDSGRRQMNEVNQSGLEMTQTLHIRPRPGREHPPQRAGGEGLALGASGRTRGRVGGGDEEEGQ